MKFREGDILKNPEDESFALVVSVDVLRASVAVLQFGADGSFVRKFNEYDADCIFEVDNG